MVQAHDRLCDNPEYSFGVDLDEQNHVFVAHFRTPTSTDTFSSRSFYEIVQQVTQRVMHTDIPQVDGACRFGDNGAENLGQEILRACNDAIYREEHHKNCPCSKNQAA